MASRSINDLAGLMPHLAKLVITYCTNRGVDLLIYCTYRSLEEQARLYRQSRSLRQIEAKADSLTLAGYPFLADVLIDVGPQGPGPHVTNAAPGESWHNYRQAFDAVPLVAGKPAWDYAAHRQLWHIYGAGCAEVGLHWAGLWIGFVEYPHAQESPAGNPLKQHSPADIMAMLRLASPENFSNLERRAS